MQVIQTEVSPIEIKLKAPVRMAGGLEIKSITAIFVRLETRDRKIAWGATAAHPNITGEPVNVTIHACQQGAALMQDLPPYNLEYALDMLSNLLKDHPAALCALDLALYDLFCLMADMPLYRLLGGYRDRIQTSVTVPIATVQESVEIAKAKARLGYRMLKIKGGVNPEEDIYRIKAIHRALPDHILRLDADGGYAVQDAISVAKELHNDLEMIEQPTHPDRLDELFEVTHHSPVPVLADQSVKGPSSALKIASNKMASGISIKLASCGGLHCARQMVSLARAAQMAVMVSCVIEPALLTAAGLSLALSSPSVRYGDLDGYLDLINDPTQIGFKMEDGWLITGESPGLGCTVNLS